MSNAKKVFSGATLGSVLGTMAALLYPRRNEIMQFMREHSNDFHHITDKAKDYGNSLFNNGLHRRESRHDHWKSGLAGLIIGVGAALLLAPKSGKALRGQLTRAYNEISDKSEGFVHHFRNGTYSPFPRINAKKRRPAAAPKRKAHK